jgi:uncharacterized protein with GYD domain
VAHDVMSSSLSESGRKVLRERPDGIRTVERERERKGARVRAQHAASGPFDFVAVREAADNETVSSEMRARGSVHMLTMSGIPLDSVIGRPAQGGHRRGRSAKRRR